MLQLWMEDALTFHEMRRKNFNPKSFQKPKFASGAFISFRT